MKENALQKNQLFSVKLGFFLQWYGDHGCIQSSSYMSRRRDKWVLWGQLLLLFSGFWLANVGLSFSLHFLLLTAYIHG